MPKLQIVTNVPADVRLLSIEAEIRPSQYAPGGQELLYRTDQGDVYVPLPVGPVFAAAIAEHGIRPNDPVRILKGAADIGNGRKAIRWTLTPAGAQSNGTLAVPRDTRHDTMHGIEPRPPAQAHTAVSEFAARLARETNAIVDAFALSLKHANDAYGHTVKPDDVRSILLSAYINAAKNGARNAA